MSNSLTVAVVTAVAAVRGDKVCHLRMAVPFNFSERSSEQTLEQAAEHEVVARFFSSPNSETYASLFRAVVKQITAYFRARGCRPPADEDLAQDVLFTVYRSSHQLRAHNLFRPWLFTIARNALLQHQKTQGREDVVELGDYASPPTDPLAAMQFGQWMNALNPDEREVLTLRYVDGLEYHEIAAVLGIPMGTVQWRVFQSKRKLAARFAREG